jgi:hypothetical protein
VLNITEWAIAVLYDILMGEVKIAPHPGTIKILGSDDFGIFNILGKNCPEIFPLFGISNTRPHDGAFSYHSSEII